MGHVARRLFILLLVSLGALAVAAPAIAADGPAPSATLAHTHTPGTSPRSSAGRVIVCLRDGVSTAATSTLAESLGARVVRRLPSAGDGRLVVLRASSRSSRDLVARLTADSRVRYAEPDTVLTAQAAPDDPYFSLQWSLPQVSAPAAWDVSTGSDSVVVASIDSGVDYTHTDLTANMWRNPGETPGNGLDDDANGYVDDVYGIDRAYYDANPMDEEGHGTFTAGIMAARGDNAVGVCGMAWSARVMALRFLDEWGEGYTSDAVTCIQYAIAQKAKGVDVVAINASWGGSAYSQSLRDAIAAAGEAGIVFVAAAGNGAGDAGVTPSYPASFDCANIISVASTDRFDGLAATSNWGATSVDLAAPGVSVAGTLPYDIYEAEYGTGSGTSFAAPHVTGAIALCAVVAPGDTVAQRISRVLSTVDPVPSLAGKCVTGGRLNVSAAVGGAAAGDDALPGVPLGTSPRAGTLDAATDVRDIYSVFLKAGEELTLSLAGPDGTVFGATVHAPGTTDLAASTPLAATEAASYPKTCDFVAAATGTYYVVVATDAGSGAYSLAHTVVDDDEIPGRPAAASPINGSLSATDSDDVHAVKLAHGQTLTASITGPAGSDFRLLLYDPWSSSIWDDDPIAGATMGSYPRSFSFKAWESGTYYLDAWAYTGAGAYTITWSIAPADADDDVPGVPLPASPVAGALSPEGDYDLYSFPLQAGRTARFTVSGVAGFEFDLSVYAPGTTSIETAWPVAMEYSDGFAQTSLTYLAPTTGVYYLLVYPEAGSGAYAIAHDVDVTPPVTTVVGADDRWHRTAVTLTFAAGDDASGVAYVESSLDGGTWSKGFTRLVGGNGARTVAYRAVDAAGNTEATRQVTVNVDAGRPKPVALANATVKKGEKATLRFRVDDITPRATCKIKVYKGARLVKTLKVGAVTTNSSTSYRWICKLARGKYTWKLSATDLAGNHELNPGVRRLTVK